MYNTFLDILFKLSLLSLQAPSPLYLEAHVYSQQDAGENIYKVGWFEVARSLLKVTKTATFDRPDLATYCIPQ